MWIFRMQLPPSEAGGGPGYPWNSSNWPRGSAWGHSFLWGVGLAMIKWRMTVWCRGSKQRELNTKGGRGWKHSWRTMSCRREVLSGDPAGATPRVFKDFMSAWLAKMKGPAANFNFLMTQRNHEQYIDRIWICNKQWPNPQKRIVGVDQKKKKTKHWSSLGSPFRPPLYWEFYFQEFILEEPLRLGVGN